MLSQFIYCCHKHKRCVAHVRYTFFLTKRHLRLLFKLFKIPKIQVTSSLKKKIALPVIPFSQMTFTLHIRFFATIYNEI
jgi:hypothetical protein